MPNINQGATSASLELYVSKLIEEKNFQNITSEVVTQIKADLMTRVEDRINAVIIKNMPEEKNDEFDKMLDSASDEEIRVFCGENIPNLDELIAEELVRFRKIYLNI
jgi:hypothetical protein